MNTEKKLEICVNALEEIQHPKGAYSMDRLEHAENTIEEVVKIASEALKKIK